MTQASDRLRVLFQMGGMVSARRRSGVHRVSAGLARALPQIVETDFVLWDAQETALRYAGVSDLDQLFGPGDWPDGVEVRPEARRLGPSGPDFRRGTSNVWLVDPEIAYHAPGGVEGLRRRTRRLRRSGIRTAALAHDLIPIRRADYLHDRAVHEAYVAELFQADLLLAVSRHTAETFAVYGREAGFAPVPIQVCPLPDGGFRSPPAAPRRADGPVELLMVGSVEPRKRQIQAISAFARARRRSPAARAARLRVIGAVSGAVASEFRRLVSRTPGVEYLDYASDETLSAAYDAATATLFPSEDEGFGLPIAESLARGTPCLCADFGAMSEVAAGGGCLQVDVRDDDALEAAIVALCERPELRERLRAEIGVRSFRDWDDYAQEVVQALSTQPLAAWPPFAAHEEAVAAVASAAPPVVAVSASAAPAPVLAGSRAMSLTRLPLRLALALARNGPGAVVRFSLDLLARRGLRGAARYALSRGRARPRRRPLALNAAFALPEADWRAWMDERRPAHPVGRGAPERRAGRLQLVVHVEGEDPANLARTRASVAALRLGDDLGGEGVVGVSEGAHVPPPAAPVFHLFLQAGDRLDPAFGAALAGAIERGRAELVTFDLTEYDAAEVRPLFLPGANPVFALAAPAFYSRFAIAEAALPDGWRGTAAADVMGAWIAATPQRHLRGRWRHVAEFPVVQISRPLEPPAPIAKPEAPAADVSVVICTKDKGHLTRVLVRGLLNLQPGVRDIVIVSNGTTSPHALKTLEDLAGLPRVRVVACDEPFNFSKLANMGAAQTQGGVLLFLNDDVVPVSEDWLARMAAWLRRPLVGAVGPLLIYPNERVQHAGMHLGFHGIAGHTLRHAVLPRDDYLCFASAPREVSSLTGAALMTPRSVFEALGGFDEQLATYLQDVDYCLRVREGGWRNIFQPAAVLLHMESISVSEAPAGVMGRLRALERDRFIARWGAVLEHDPLFPGGLDPEDEGLRTLRPGQR